MSRLSTVFILFVSISLCFPAYSEEVNVYSARKEALIKPLLDKFSAQTGIEVNLVTGSGDALLTRLKAEGKNSPADLLITSDAGRLHRAKMAEVLQPVTVSNFDSHVAQNYRDAEGFWFGLSVRSRVIVFAKDRVKPSELSSYQSLTDKKWRGRLCVRSSGNIYNQSLVAGMIAVNGAENAEQWAKGVVNNLARPPRGGDRDQIKAVASGLCDVAIVNSYYLGAMLNSDSEEQRSIAQQVNLFWPNQDGRGAHVNVSGAGVTKAAKHKGNAIKLIEYLSSAASQQWYADANNEFPVRKDVVVSQVLASWGSFKPDPLAVNRLGELNAEAVQVMDRAGWK